MWLDWLFLVASWEFGFGRSGGFCAFLSACGRSTGNEATFYCHLNTAEPVLQLYSDEAADHRVHLHLSLPSIPNLIMDDKRTSRLSLPECIERMRKTMKTPLNHTIMR